MCYGREGCTVVCARGLATDITRGVTAVHNASAVQTSSPLERHCWNRVSTPMTDTETADIITTVVGMSDASGLHIDVSRVTAPARASVVSQQPFDSSARAGDSDTYVNHCHRDGPARPDGMNINSACIWRAGTGGAGRSDPDARHPWHRKRLASPPAAACPVPRQTKSDTPNHVIDNHAPIGHYVARQRPKLDSGRQVLGRRAAHAPPTASETPQQVPAVRRLNQSRDAPGAVDAP